MTETQNKPDDGAIEALYTAIEDATEDGSVHAVDLAYCLHRAGYEIKPIAAHPNITVGSGCVFADIGTCLPNGRCVNAKEETEE